jgi:hypothetical protein
MFEHIYIYLQVNLNLVDMPLLTDAIFELRIFALILY